MDSGDSGGHPAAPTAATPAAAATAAAAVALSGPLPAGRPRRRPRLWSRRRQRPPGQREYRRVRGAEAAEMEGARGEVKDRREFYRDKTLGLI